MTIKRTIFADLHTHSNASDGDYSPTDVIKKAQSAGLKAIALTDHDTLSGIIEAAQAAEVAELDFIPGAELSICFDRPFFKGTIHYLVYFSIDTLSNLEFKNEFDQTVSPGRGEELTTRRIERINKLYGPHGSIDRILKQELTIDQIDRMSPSVTRRHFAVALNKHHDLNNDTINHLIGNSSPAYIPSGIESDRLKPLFSKYRLLKILAHPAAGSYLLSGHYSESLPPFETVKQLLPEFINLGLDGLEVFYPGHRTNMLKN